MLTAELLRIVDSYSWDPAPCRITAISVADRGGENPYHVEVQYTYDYGGTAFSGSRFALSENGSSEYRDAQSRVAQYPVGSTAECYVNPAKPSEAIVEHSSLWFGLFLIIPLVFLAVGGGGVYFSLRKGQPAGAISRAGTSASDSGTVPTSISSKASGAWKGRGILAAFFSVFLLAGIGMAFPLLINPIQNYFDAGEWLVLDCTVESSRVRSHDSDDGTTYSVDILYRYEVEGIQYKSNAYSFIGGSSSGYDSKREIVKKHPPGKVVPCYVNPDDPSEAVLNREMGWEFLLGLIPLVFAAVGAGGLMFTFGLRGGGARGARAFGQTSAQPLSEESWLPPEPPVSFSARSAGPVLKPSASPLGKLIGMILVSAFVTGIVSVFANEVWQGWQAGNPDWFLTLFLTPFLLMVVASWGGIIYCFLGLWNPRPEVSLQTLSPRLGEPVSLQWRLLGRVSSISSLSISIEGTEEATYTRGTNTHTDRRQFQKIAVVENLPGRQAAAGEANFTIPADSMHSFVAANNKITWALKIKGEIPRWPDISESFTLRVLPAAKKRDGGGLW